VTPGELIFGIKSPLAKYAPSLAKYGAPMVQYAKVFDQPANNRTKPPKEAVLGTKYGMSKYNKDYEKAFCGERKLECSFPDNMCVGSFENTGPFDGIRVIGVRWYFFILLIMFVWWSIIYNELRETSLMAYVVFNLPSTSITDMSSRNEDGALIVHGLSIPVRVYLCLAVLIPRFLMSCYLAFQGTQWLQRTFTVSDLVLNF